MRRATGRRVWAGLAIAVALALAGCGGDADPGTTGTGSTGGGGGGTGGSAPYQLVLPDQVSVSPDSGRVMADCWNGICTWDAGTGTLELLPDRGHVAVSPDWSLVASVGDDAEVVLEELGSGAVDRELTGLEDADVADGSPVEDVAFSGDGSRVAAVGGGRVVVWAVDDGAETASIELGHDARRVTLSPDGSQLATSGDGPVQVHDVASGELVAELAGSSPTEAATAWSADGRWLIGPGADAAPTVWSTDSFEVVEEGRGTLYDAAVAPDSRSVAVTGDGDAVLLWAPEVLGGSGRTRELAVPSGDPGAVAFAPDGGALYAVSADDGILAWELPRPGDARQLELPEGR